MKLHGYCLDCHKIKLVRVTYPHPGQVQQGICDDCQEKRDERRAAPDTWARMAPAYAG